MTQAFLNEPTIVRAREKYLESWSTPSVKKAWNGRRPTLAQFIDRFSESYHARQMYLKANPDTHQQILADRRMDDVQALAEEVHDRIGATLDSLTPPRFAELDEDAPPPPPAPQEDDEVAQAHAAVEEQSDENTVKEKNKGKLPTSGQIFFFMHRAKEAGFGFCMIPTTRQKAAEMRGLIAEGKTYTQALMDMQRKSREEAK